MNLPPKNRTKDFWDCTRNTADLHAELFDDNIKIVINDDLREDYSDYFLNHKDALEFAWSIIKMINKEPWCYPQ